MHVFNIFNALPTREVSLKSTTFMFFISQKYSQLVKISQKY